MKDSNAESDSDYDFTQRDKEIKNGSTSSGSSAIKATMDRITQLWGRAEPHTFQINISDNKN